MLDEPTQEIKPPDLYTGELTRGNLKMAMKVSAQGSGEVWKVKRSDIKIRPGFNARLMNDSYKAHIRWLADSISANGFYPDMPISVSIAVEDGVNIIYASSGHSRLAAFDLVVAEGVEISDLIPCVAEARGVSEVDRTVALHTSNNGKPLAPYELGLVCQRLMHFGISSKDIRKRLSLKSNQVDDLLLLVTAPMVVRTLVINEKISASLAIEMIKKHGNRAGSILTASLKTASKEGVSKVTKRYMPGQAFKNYVTKSAPKAFLAIQSISKHESYVHLPDDIKAIVDELLSGLPITK